MDRCGWVKNRDMGMCVWCAGVLGLPHQIRSLQELSIKIRSGAGAGTGYIDICWEYFCITCTFVYCVLCTEGVYCCFLGTATFDGSGYLSCTKRSFFPTAWLCTSQRRSLKKVTCMCPHFRVPFSVPIGPQSTLLPLIDSFSSRSPVRLSHLHLLIHHHRLPLFNSSRGTFFFLLSS